MKTDNDIENNIKLSMVAFEDYINVHTRYLDDQASNDELSNARNNYLKIQTDYNNIVIELKKENALKNYQQACIEMEKAYIKSLTTNYQDVEFYLKAKKYRETMFKKYLEVQ